MSGLLRYAAPPYARCKQLRGACSARRLCSGRAAVPPIFPPPRQAPTHSAACAALSPASSSDRAARARLVDAGARRSRS